MKIARTAMRGATLGLFLAGSMGGAVLAQAASAPPADFGTPPSGQVPILFNDRHVYSKPDKLKENRVLAALVRNNVILVPLRSMFEQTGATVSWDASSKTVDVSKPGSDVKVTIGKPVVVINGEERPLDVPPEMYRGAVVVPLRVISEGMGAYVQWVPEKRIVVVRYVEAIVPTPAPTPPPTPAPVVTPPPPRPTAPPTPTPVAPVNYEKFVAGDYLISPKIYNELSPGNTSNGAYMVHGAVEFKFVGLPWMVSGDYRHFNYPHNSGIGVVPCGAGTAGCNTVVGHDTQYNFGLCPAADQGCVTVPGYQNLSAYNGLGQAYVPRFTPSEGDFDGHFGLKVADPRVYISFGYYTKSYSYLGYPGIGGIGFGLEKLPDLDQPLSVFGSVYYYPSVGGVYTYPTSTFLGTFSGSKLTMQYNALKYAGGATLTLGKSHLFVEGGYQGERLTVKQNAPSDTSEGSAFAGLGLHF